MGEILAPPPAPASSEPRAIEVVLGLGSNLGDRLARLRSAADALGSLSRALPSRSPRRDPLGPGHPSREAPRALAVVARSRVFESAPVGGPTQPPYLNAALLVRTTLEPAALLAAVLDLERRIGRVRPDPVRWGPRVIDIDLLWIRGIVVSTPELCVPHPRLRERAFALRPLVEVAPDAVDPERGDRYADLDAAREPLAVVGPL